MQQDERDIESQSRRFAVLTQIPYDASPNASIREIRSRRTIFKRHGYPHTDANKTLMGGGIV